jgi:hypothetical protein
MKVCTKCKIEKKLTEFYYKKSKISSWCKSCQIKKQKKYYQKNKEKCKEQYKNYYYENPERSHQRVADYRIKKQIEKLDFYDIFKSKLYQSIIKDYTENKVFYIIDNENKIIFENTFKFKSIEYLVKNKFYSKEQLYKSFLELKKQRLNRINYSKQKSKITISKKVTDKIYREANKEYYKKKTREWQKEKRKTDPIFKFKTCSRQLLSDSFKRACNGQYRKSKKTEEMLGCDMNFFMRYIKSKFKKGMTFENHGEWHIDHIIPISSANTEEEIIALNYYTNLQPLWAKENQTKSNKILEQQLVLL